MVGHSTKMQWSRYSSCVLLVAIVLICAFGVHGHQKVPDFTSRSEKMAVRSNVINEGEEESDDDRWKQETAPPYEQVPFDRYFYENVFRFSNIHGILRKHRRLLSSVVDRSDGKCGATKPYEKFCRQEGRSGTVKLYGHQNSQCFLQCDMYGTAFVFRCPIGTHWNGEPDQPSPYNRCIP